MHLQTILDYKVLDVSYSDTFPLISDKNYGYFTETVTKSIFIYCLQNMK